MAPERRSSAASSFAFLLLALLGANLTLAGAATVACVVRHARDPTAQCNMELQACQRAASQIGTVGVAILGMGIFTKSSQSPPGPGATVVPGDGRAPAAPAAAIP